MRRAEMMRNDEVLSTAWSIRGVVGAAAILFMNISILLFLVYISLLIDFSLPAYIGFTRAMSELPLNFIVDEVELVGKELNKSSELKKPNDPADVSPLEADDFDFSLSFSDSFLDFDSIKDWIEESDTGIHSMDGVKSELDAVCTEGMEFGIMQKCIEMSKNVSCKEIGVNIVDLRDGQNVAGSEKVEIGIAKEQSGFSKEIKVEGPAVAGLGIGTSICSINEEIMKICLEGKKEIGEPCLEGVSKGELISNGNTAAKGSKMVWRDGKDISSEVVIGNEDSKKGVVDNGIASGEVRSIIPDGGEVFYTASKIKNNEKNRKGKSDKDGSDDSSVESSGSDDDGGNDVEEEDGDEEKQEADVLERVKIDMEEGEIMDSDADEIVAWNDDEDGDGVGESSTVGPIRSKNELQVLPWVPPVDVTLGPNHQTQPVGIVLSIVGAQVIVEGLEKHNPLNEGSIVWITETRSPLGLVDEIFGPVKNPYYIVRYNLESDVPTGIQRGTLISFVPEYANHVLNDHNLYKKGYDASGENDEEASDEAEFSDDEKEAEYKRKLKMSRSRSDQKPGNRKKDEKKFKNRAGTWKNNCPSAIEGYPALSEQQHSAQPLSTQLGSGNFSTPLGPVQGFSGGQGLLPPFSQVSHASGFVASSNGAWQRGIPSLQPPNMGYPNGFPTTNIIPVLQGNQPQQPYEMPSLSGVPFQQQFPPYFAPPPGQSNFSDGSSFVSPMCLNQSGFNQLQFVMGLLGQHTSSPLNLVGQGVPSNALPVESSSNLQPPSSLPGNVEASLSFSQAGHSSRGKKPYPRGGGRFVGGRGRQQFVSGRGRQHFVSGRGRQQFNR